MATMELVAGLTQTSRDLESPSAKLERLLIRKKGGSIEMTNTAIDRLRDAIGMEGNVKVRDRLTTALAVLQGRDTD